MTPDQIGPEHDGNELHPAFELSDLEQHPLPPGDSFVDAAQDASEREALREKEIDYARTLVSNAEGRVDAMTNILYSGAEKVSPKGIQQLRERIDWKPGTTEVWDNAIKTALHVSGSSKLLTRM